MQKFWNWVRGSENQRTLHLYGPIAEETWWGDEITPQMFKDELLSGTGDITVWINSPGGDCFAAAQIYNMLMEYKGHVSVVIDGIAASAASVIAMAGGEVKMSPVAMLMIHNPSTLAIGDSAEMVRAKGLLDEVKESIINAYELKTGISRTKLAHMMDAETWMNANKAIELGFADAILYADEATPATPEPPMDANEGRIFSRMAVYNSLLSKFPQAGTPLPASTTEPDDPPAEGEPPLAEEAPPPAAAPPTEKTEQPTGTPVESLYKRLSLISH